MEWIRRIGNWIKAVIGLGRKNADLDEEIAAHIEMRTELFIEDGMDPRSARKAALKGFGNAERLKEECRDAWGTRVVTDLIRDTRFSIAQLIKNRGFTVANVAVLALGIGGVTAMFSVFHTVMLKPLPYAEPDRLVMGRTTYSGGINPIGAVEDYYDFRDESQSFAAFEAFRSMVLEVTVSFSEGAERADATVVSAGLLDCLGEKAHLGRNFTPMARQAEVSPEIVISYRYWQDHLNGREDAIGDALLVDGLSRTIVGVTREGFSFINEADIWFPMSPRSLNTEPRKYNNWLFLGRLKDGVMLSQAQSEVDMIAARLEQAYPDTNENKGLLLTPLHGALSDGYEGMFEILIAGSVVILLIAWANAAGLLLARGASRHGELAVRSALGASFLTVIRLVMVESFVLATLSGICGIVLAFVIQKGLVALLPIEALLLGEIDLSIPILMFAIAVTTITGIGIGLLPALRSAKASPAKDLGLSGRGFIKGKTRLRSALVVGQISLSFVLLVAAGLFIRSLDQLHSADIGFDPHNLLTVELPMPGQESSPNIRLNLLTSLLDRTRSIPGVISATAANQLPLRNPWNNVDIYAEMNPPVKASESPSGYQRVVIPGYFETMGIPLSSGRDFASTDTRQSERVVVISELLAEQLFPNENPLGKRVIVDRRRDVDWKVVGVVGDVQSNNLYQRNHYVGTFYRPYGQLAPLTMRIAIRTQGNPYTALEPFRTALRSLDSRIPLSGPRTMKEVMSNSTLLYRSLTVFTTVYSGLALVLAAIGIYGVLAYAVAQNRREIGIRMALGANASMIVQRVLGFGMTLVGIGLLIGLSGAFIVSQSLRDGQELFGIEPTDLLTYASVFCLLSLITVVACVIPAKRATRVNPMNAIGAD